MSKEIEIQGEAKRAYPFILDSENRLSSIGLGRFNERQTDRREGYIAAKLGEYRGLKPGQRWYVTEIKAIHPIRNEIALFGGPTVPGISFEDAQAYCNNNIGYCKVIGELVSEIPTKEDGHTPDWDNRIDYDNSNQ